MDWRQLQKEMPETETRERLQLSLLWCFRSLLKKKERKKKELLLTDTVGRGFWVLMVFQAIAVSCPALLVPSSCCSCFLRYVCVGLLVYIIQVYVQLQSQYFFLFFQRKKTGTEEEEQFYTIAIVFSDGMVNVVNVVHMKSNKHW